MQRPPRSPATTFEALLQELPCELASLARPCGAFTRARKIKTPTQLLQMVFFYSGLEKSLRDVAGERTLRVERITDSAVRERLEACGPWGQALLAHLVRPSALPPLPSGWRLLVIDGSQVQAPGATGTDYRLHVCLELTPMRVGQVGLTDKHTGESWSHFALGRGALVLADRHYATAASIVEAVQQHVELVVRMSAQRLPVYQQDGTRFDLPSALEAHEETTLRTWAIEVKSSPHQPPVKGYVQAYHLPEEAANRARQRVRRERKKKGHTPTATTLRLAAWVLVFTTGAPVLRSASALLALYRTRWQVELASKRWTSFLDVDALRARAGSPLAALWLQGKLLYAARIAWRAYRQCGESGTRLDGERQVTWGRLWKLVKDEVDVCILSVQARHPADRDACVEVLAERPRRRQLQRLPEEVIAFTQDGYESAQDEMSQAA